MDENKVLTERKLLLTYLDQVLSSAASKLVGKLLKRFEIIEDPNTLKKEAKELIYECFRDMSDIFEAYGEGIEMTVFNFKQNKEK